MAEKLMADNRPEPHRMRMSSRTPYDPVSSPPQRARPERRPGRSYVVRETPWVRLEVAAASARGRQHQVNEDWHSTLDGSAPLFVVADGVGGGAMAARASRELVSQLHAVLDRRHVDAAAIRNALLRADREVGKSIASHSRESGAATVALCAGRGKTLSEWLVGWVGDCRIYKVSAAPNESAQLLTVDDTYRVLKEVPPPGGSYDDPARMVGNGAVVAPNVEAVLLRSGEMLVICSDGVHKHVEAADLSRVLRGSAPLLRRCWRLLALARARGSKDDATVVVVSPEPRLPGLVSLLGVLVFAGVLVALLALMVAQ